MCICCVCDTAVFGELNLQLCIYHWTLYIYIGDGDTQMFWNDLITAYKICTKENNGSAVTLDHLANKYLETHSKEEYKKNLKGIGLKTCLVKSDHFAVTQNIVTITKGNI